MTLALCQHHTSSAPGQSAVTTWQCGSGRGAAPQCVAGAREGSAGHALCRCWPTQGTSPRTRGRAGTLPCLPRVGLGLAWAAAVRGGTRGRPSGPRFGTRGIRALARGRRFPGSRGSPRSSSVFPFLQRFSAQPHGSSPVQGLRIRFSLGFLLHHFRYIPCVLQCRGGRFGRWKEGEVLHSPTSPPINRSSFLTSKT
jgi:hypothetical protein